MIGVTAKKNANQTKKRILKRVLLVLLTICLLIAGIIGYGVYWLFFDWSRFKQDFITESTSPQGTYTIHAYRSDSGATISYAVLGELIFNKEERKSKKIYWQYREEDAEIEWIDDDTVRINDVTLELPEQSYDYRKGIN